MRGPFLLVTLAVAGLSANATASAAPRPPVVVELFTAQGCTGCPQADRMLEDVGGRKGVIALTLPVDYWDYLGWADTFAKSVFAERQRAYAGRLKVREIYTPQVVVDGRKEASGLDQDAIDALVMGAAHDLAEGPRVSFLHDGTRVRVAPGRAAAAHAEVWLVRFDPQEHAVKVKAGDNKGKLVSQRYVVRELVRLGGYGGGVRSFALPKPGDSGLATVVLVQAAKGGRILTAAEG